MHKTKEAKFVHQVDKFEMALQAKIYSKQMKPSNNISIFFESAKKEINNANILKLFKQLVDK